MAVAGIVALALGLAIFFAHMRKGREDVEPTAGVKTPAASMDTPPVQPLAETLPHTTDSRVAEAPSPVSTPAVNGREAMNRLTIVVKSSTGGVPSDLQLVIASGDKLLFPAANWDFTPFSERFDHAKWLGNSIDTQGYKLAHFELPASGVLNLTGIVVGEAIRVEVLAALDISLHEEDLPALGATETRTVTVSIASIPNRLSGTVSDERGRPVAGAKLQAWTDSLDPIGRDIMGRVETLSDPAGRYQFPALYVDRIHVETACMGFVARLIDIELGPATSFAIVLQSGAHVAVGVIDAARRPVDVGVVWATFEDGQLTAHAKKLVAGEYEFTDLPHSEVVISFNVGGVLYERKHDALVASVTIALPAHGQVEVTWDLPAEFDMTNTYLNLRPLGKDARRPLGERLSARAGSFTFEHLLPGLYEIGIEHYGQDGTHTLLFGYEDVLVQANSTARMTIRP